MPDYNVKQGDCISSIAFEKGFFWETIWGRPENAAIVALRDNPNALAPDDKLFIPDKRLKEESGATTLRHTFRLKGVPVRFQLQLLTHSNQPRPNLPFSLEVDGATIDGKTDQDGQISEIIKPNAKKATLTVRPPGGVEEKYLFNLGHMNPISEITGIQARLQNLGYYTGEISGSADDETQEAIKNFQRDYGLEETGVADAAMQAALEGRYGG